MPAKHLHTFRLDSDFELAKVHQIPRVTLESPATSVFHDFRLHPTVTVTPDTHVDEAQWLLEQSHIPELMVVDQRDHFYGLASRQCLSEQLIMRLVSQSFKRADLTVSDLMIPRRFIAAMDYSELASTSVANVIEVLQNEGLKNLLIVDKPSREVIGILSSGLLDKLFDVPRKSPPASTFADLFEAIMH